MGQGTAYILVQHIILSTTRNFFIGKKTVVETISVAINDSFNVPCFDLYLIINLENLGSLGEMFCSS